MNKPVDLSKVNHTLTTIMTDASFCPDTGASGWGIYIRNQGGLLEQGGNFKENPKCAFEAELMAIAIGVLMAFKHGHAGKDYHLIIQTDCKMAIMALNGNNGVFEKSSYHLVERVRQTFRDIKKKYNVTWHLRHVKAHNPGRAPRNWANERCDQHARKFMREQRFVIRAAQGKAFREVDNKISS